MWEVSITGHAQSEKPGALCPTLRIRRKDSPNISEETSLQARSTRIAQTKRWENPPSVKDTLLNVMEDQRQRRGPHGSNAYPKGKAFSKRRPKRKAS